MRNTIKNRLSCTDAFPNCFFGAAVVAAAIMFLSPAARADGTDAGTDITNTATVDYKVNDADQPTETSDPYVFKVDRKIDVLVSEAGGTTVSNSQLDAVLPFTVTNTGNDEFDYLLAVENVPAGETADDFDTSNLRIYIDLNSNGVPDTGEDYATLGKIDDLAKDASITVLVVSDIPGSLSSGDTANLRLKATAVDDSGAEFTEDTDGDDPAVVENVFADGDGPFVGPGPDDDRDGEHSDTNTYTVSAAAITVTKSSEVLWDPVNETTNPLAIPQALVEYTITISNGTGAATATNIVVTDNLNTEITNGTLAFYANGYAAGDGIQVTAPNLYTGNPTALSNASDTDEGEFNTTTNTVTVSDIELAADQTATVKFRVWITSEPDPIPGTVP